MLINYAPCHDGSEGRAPAFYTSKLDGGHGQLHGPAALPRETTVKEAVLAPETVWTLRIRDKSIIPKGNRTQGVQPFARCYTEWIIITGFFKRHSVIIPHLYKYDRYDLYLGDPRFESWPEHQVSWEVTYGIPQSLLTSFRIWRHIKPRQVPSVSIPNHYSLTASLHKLQNK